MVIHVKDEEADALVRELARLRGIGITAAIKEAVSEAIEVDKVRVESRVLPLGARLKPLLDRLDQLPGHDIATGKEFFDNQWDEKD